MEICRQTGESSVYVTFYERWDFDWSNALQVCLKVGGKEKHLHFFMEKFFILTKKTTNIEELGKTARRHG